MEDSFHIAHVGPPGGVDVPFVGCDAFDPEKLDPPGGQSDMLICPSEYSCPGHNSVSAGKRWEDSLHIAHVGPLGGLDVPFGGK